MRSYVIDASVGIKWFVPEVHEQAALDIYRSTYEFIAPDLIYAEIGNILWKKWRRGEISDKVASGILRDFKEIKFLIYQSLDLAEETLNIAKTYNLSFYDSLYVSVAVKTDTALITADQKLFQSLSASPLSGYLHWIEDLPI